MSAENVIEEVEAEPGSDERDRSTVAFPYADLNNAIRIARGINEVSGRGACQWEQLAAQMNVAVRGGGFRLMAAAAKTFGLITYVGKGTVQLTDLGSRILDPTHEKQARVDAFLNVELYKKLYDSYRPSGGKLPPTSGLEAEMVQMGVAKKVVDRARQYFVRSAQQAGFFAIAQDRLVMPGAGPSGGGSEKKDPPADPPKPPAGEGGGGGGRSSLLQGLLDELPAERTQWSIEDRVSWLELAAAIFERVYGKTGERITVSK